MPSIAAWHDWKAREGAVPVAGAAKLWLAQAQRARSREAEVANIAEVMSSAVLTTADGMSKFEAISVASVSICTS